MAGFLGDDDLVPCKVVVNLDGQYSLWPQERDNPPGWADEGFRGSRRDCVEHIDKVWKDMLPRSLRDVRQ